MYIEVPYYQEGDVQGWKEGIGGDGVDPVVACVGLVGLDQPKGGKVCPEKRCLGGDIKGEDRIHPFEPLKH